MKRGLLVLIAAMMLVAAMSLVGCENGTDNKGLENFLAKYEKLSEATSIEEEITIKSGALTKYVGSKKFTKTESGYNVKETEKRRGELGSETADEDGFEVTEKEYAVESNDSGVMKLNFAEENFSSYELTESGFKATAKDEKVKTVLGVDELESEVKSLTVEIKADETKVNGITVTYITDGADAVTITFKITY